MYPKTLECVPTRTWSAPRVTTTGQMQSRGSVMEKDWMATGLKLRMLRGGHTGHTNKPWNRVEIVVESWNWAEIVGMQPRQTHDAEVRGRTQTDMLRGIEDG